MKNILLFVCVAFISINTQGQNSDVWQKVQELRQQYFPSTAHIPVSSVKLVTRRGRADMRDTITRTWQEYQYISCNVILDDRPISSEDPTGVQMALDSLNKYRMADIAGIDYILEGQNQNYGSYGYKGVILLYTRAYTYTHPPMRHKFKISYLSPNDPVLGRYYQERRKQEKKQKKGKK
jgi:hypothetical protein